MTLTSGMAKTARVIDVATEIRPLHWWRPIRNESWALMSQSAGDITVVRLKDNGRSSTKLELEQTLSGSQYFYGLDSEFNQPYMDGNGAHREMSDVTGTAADIKFATDGTPFTVAYIVQVDDNSTTQNALLVFGTSASAAVGCYERINGSAGTSHIVLASLGSGNGCIELAMGSNHNLANGTKIVMIARHRAVTDTAVGANPENIVSARLRVNGVEWIINNPAPSNFSASDPGGILRLGSFTASGSNGIRGRIYEIIADNRWWSDVEVARYEQRAQAAFGVDLSVM